jgi:catechol 2,3-dioxygenase-like lactoylglutathione lyase family enzyme
MSERSEGTIRQSPSENLSGQASLKLEVVTIPVADLDRAKRFYEGLGWRLDADFPLGGGRAIQFTPPGSDCSIHFAPATDSSPAGSAQGLFLAVPDLDAARADLERRGVQLSEVFHLTPDGRGAGPAPGRATYNSYVAFSDPDGNGWLVQEITTRLPGRVDPGVTAFPSVSALASALRRAAEAHGRHEERHGGVRDENWPDWYAEFLASEQAGTEPPE